MTGLLIKEKPAHVGLVDRFGMPLSDAKVEKIALAGYKPEQRLIDLAKDMPSTARHTVAFPAPAKMRLHGESIDRRWTEREKRELTRFIREEFARTGIPIIAGGAAGAWTFVNSTRTNALNGTFDFDTDSFKIALFLSTSDIGATETTYAGVTNEHSNANGYTTGGIAQTLTLSGTTTVTVAASASPTWTASGGSIVARFAVLYEVSGNVVCYCLLDSAPADVTTTTGNTFTIATATSIFTVA